MIIFACGNVCKKVA